MLVYGGYRYRSLGAIQYTHLIVLGVVGFVMV